MARKVHSRPLLLAALFLFAYALALSLSPMVRLHTWQTAPRLEAWPVLLVWLAGSAWTWRDIQHRRLSPYPALIALLLSGWGMLSITRLSVHFGMRQALWFLVALGLFHLTLRLPADLRPLRRYKTFWLSGGVLLTSATLLFGTHPTGNGPRLWLGCCGVYLQPSEPLKLLLLIYLAAYLADRQQALRSSPSPLTRLLLPTLVMTGLALAVLLAQRDLGTASLMWALYAVMVYLATDRWGILALSAAGLAASGALGYLLFDVVRLRVDAWLNPWADPSGRAYQIVQSLIAIANGGLLGRGPGMGSPGLVPVAHSDFIFTVIAEEQGLIGALVLITLLASLAAAGLRIAARQGDPFRRLLAAGLGAYFGGQSLWIVGGNIRLLPLTGVTLPFVSYGGSSLVTAFLGLGLLLQCARRVPSGEDVSATWPSLRYVLHSLLIGFGALALLTIWWTTVRAPSLLHRTDNLRREIAARTSPRGDILDRHGQPLAVTVGQPGDYRRRYLMPSLGPLIGYTHPRFGQAGLEAALDGVLRGEEGQPWLRSRLYRLLYGTPPPGLDVRLTLDATWQALADEVLGDRAGAVVLMDAASGEILVMASHPTFNANRLDDIGEALQNDPRAPLLNRATQARYPAIGMLRAFGLVDGRLLDAAFRLPQGVSQGGGVSPLQVALLVSGYAKNGLRPAPQIVAQIGDAPAAPLDAPRPLSLASQGLTLPPPPRGLSFGEDGAVWFVSLLPADDSRPPLALVLVLENGTPRLAEMLGAAIWDGLRRAR